MLSLFYKKIKTDKVYVNPINAALISKTNTTNIINNISEDLIKELKNGTQAERNYGKELEQTWIKEKVIKWALERSQEIDLISILKKRTADNKPMWAFVNPNEEIKIGSSWENNGNGYVTKDGIYTISTNDTWRHEHFVTNINYKNGYLPKSFPVLPLKIRDLIKTYVKYDCVRSLGILYKSKEWEEVKTLDVKPDPALIMTLKGIENKYFCLAIWGDDKPEIQEFII